VPADNPNVGASELFGPAEFDSPVIAAGAVTVHAYVFAAVPTGILLVSVTGRDAPAQAGDELAVIAGIGFTVTV
jgi:hypothetical protein